MDCPEALLLSFYNVRLLQYENFVLQAKNAVNDVTDRFASYPGHSIGKKTTKNKLAWQLIQVQFVDLHCPRVCTTNQISEHFNCVINIQLVLRMMVLFKLFL